MTTQSVVAFLLLLISVAIAENVEFEHCNSPSVNESVCVIHDVQVNPCKEAANKLPCKLKLGKDAQISFNYTANFDAENATAQAYWASDIMDLPLVGMNTKACKNTKCPIVKGEIGHYEIMLNLAKYFPPREFKVKWKLWSEKNEECCFTIKIKLLAN